MADDDVTLESRRDERRAQRLQQARGPVRPGRVRVLPRDEAVRKSHRNVVGHPNFPAQGSIEWPYDQFTKRRLRDGDITLEKPAPQQTENREPEPKEPRATRNQPPTPSTS